MRIIIYIFNKNEIITDIEECARNPCLNGGTCEELQGSYKCSCPTGFTGPTCDTGRVTNLIVSKVSFSKNSHSNWKGPIVCF